MPTITADRDVCVGSGQCVLAAPEVFDQDDTGLVVLRDSRVRPDHQDAVVRAVRQCPARAITTSTSPHAAPDARPPG